MTASLTAAYQKVFDGRATLKALTENFAKDKAQFEASIQNALSIIRMDEAGVDFEKVRLARTIVEVGDCSKQGSDGASCVADAIKWFVNGKITYDNGNTNHYANLWGNYLGAKSYDRWYGQRTDCEYGMGPSHGSIIFSVGLTKARRTAPRQDDDPRIAFTADEREAVVYYLTHAKRIQEIEAKAKLEAVA